MKAIAQKIGSAVVLLCLSALSADAACTVSATDLNFGAYDTTAGSATDSVGTVHVNCTGLSLLLTYRVYLSTGGSGSYPLREMGGTGTPLGYNLYTDTVHTAVWGDGTGATSYNGNTVLLSLLAPYNAYYTAYGSIPQEQNVPAGTYSDTIDVALVQIGLLGAETLLDTTTFTVTSTVLPECTVTAANMDFGVYDPSAAGDAAATSEISVKCTDGTDYQIALDAGTGAGATYGGRVLTGQTDGSATLTYNLYTDGGYTTVWGDGSGVTGVISGQGDGLVGAVLPDAHTVYGRIPPYQDVLPQTYKDTITVTVTY